MNHNLTEINNLDNIKSNSNHWEIKKEIPKRKKVTFDDILSTMNIVVNKNGVLQHMAPITPIYQEESYNNQSYNNQSYNNQSYTNNNNQSYNNQSYTNNNNNYNQKESYTNNNQQKKEIPLDPQVKNSTIFNKYFKDYKDTSVEIEEPRRPQTIEEYNKMLLEDRIKRIQERNRIAQIKSTKMMFTNSGNIQDNIQNSIQNNNGINVRKNNLRRMNI